MKPEVKREKNKIKKDIGKEVWEFCKECNKKTAHKILFSYKTKLEEGNFIYEIGTFEAYFEIKKNHKISAVPILKSLY